MSAARLEARNIRVGFNGNVVLNDVSLGVAPGEIVAVLGPSGSGKSTLLRVIAGLVLPTTGTVVIDGTDVTSTPTHKRGVGLVFQNNQLFPHMNVEDNVGYGLKIARVSAGARRERVRTLLDLVGMAAHARRDPSTLSGGEAARIALARSLAPQPRVLLLDEPLAGLDHDLRYSLADELRRVIRESGTTAIVVTHDPIEAQRIADRVVYLRELSSSQP